MLLTVITARPSPQLLAGWPDWLVVLVATLVAAAGLWILGKLLKLAVWVLIIVVLVAGVLATMSVLLR